MDLLDPASWTKSPTPVFAKSEANGVFGPGHNCFTQSPDGTQNWIVYHAKVVANQECKARTPRAQPFGWNPDGTPNFGLPVAADQPLPKPSPLDR
ncbi:family 43 glycosylhydrolase [Spirosoma utsteinense]|uniref:GH43 family beta-xylosidase n=1 Tax=Spirosoma utsteinense TaxID=2585773 RepID=A0ABR6WDH1_9BACT|nr:family 43 glycosylhydrolase [Spirosoma utsteinense]MBC3788693.1 GH43 family beta-xylosidase [Spirosoma utsteinense]MBC3794615.1 GH43 family beta-xylosidase [Spirosoma utsteinense]